jgi:hypothetical protein
MLVLSLSNMKKILLTILFTLVLSVSASADINLSCVMTAWNTNDDYSKNKLNIEYQELKPSQFSIIIEITSPGKVIGRLIGTADTGSMRGPYVGTMDDSKITMNHKVTKINERGTDFTLDLISGRFENEIYIREYDYWWIQKVGECKLVE